MSDPTLDALAESARNRGLKLVRSRVRTPGKRRFGKVGVTDASGKPMFGMDAKGPTAKPEDVETYLRSLAVGDWGASLGARAPKGKTKIAAKRRAPVPPPPKPQPKPRVRAAKAGDAATLVTLIGLLDHKVEVSGVRKRIGELAKAKLAPLVATLGDEVVGLCGIDSMVAIHREQPVGRITILVVGAPARGKGIGRMLVSAAEDVLRNLGCGIVEITSNDRLGEAHAFYRHMGFERTSLRFCKTL